MLPQWLLDFDAPHESQGAVWLLFILAYIHNRVKTSPSLSTPLLPFIAIDPTGNYCRGRRFDHGKWEVSREASVPFPCAPDVDHFEHYNAGGVSSDGPLEGGYQDGFEEVLRLFLSELVWLSHSSSCSNPPFSSPCTHTCIPNPSELLLGSNAVVSPFRSSHSRSSAPIASC